MNSQSRDHWVGSSHRDLWEFPPKSAVRSASPYCSKRSASFGNVSNRQSGSTPAIEEDLNENDA